MEEIGPSIWMCSEYNKGGKTAPIAPDDFGVCLSDELASRNLGPGAIS
jgi:hypothetical protein